MTNQKNSKKDVAVQTVLPITNTAEKEIHPEWVLGGNPQAIEAQEACGQKELVNSQQLPVKIDDDSKNKLEKLGVEFGEPLANDPIFCNAKLPKGWGKRPTDHSMWSDLVDASGKKVASIFYKAAFYDRSAFMRAE